MRRSSMMVRDRWLMVVVLVVSATVLTIVCVLVSMVTVGSSTVSVVVTVSVVSLASVGSSVVVVCSVSESMVSGLCSVISVNSVVSGLFVVVVGFFESCTL